MAGHISGPGIPGTKYAEYVDTSVQQPPYYPNKLMQYTQRKNGDRIQIHKDVEFKIEQRSGVGHLRRYRRDVHRRDVQIGYPKTICKRDKLTRMGEID